MEVTRVKGLLREQQERRRGENSVAAVRGRRGAEEEAATRGTTATQERGCRGDFEIYRFRVPDFEEDYITPLKEAGYDEKRIGALFEQV
jgi:hypothetical protein